MPRVWRSCSSPVARCNLDWRSLKGNDELNVVILGTEFAAPMNSMFDQDLADSENITLEKWRRRPISDRLREMYARVWAYML